ncbi:MAG: PAS domain S-box protein [Halobacteriales archaeon]
MALLVALVASVRIIYRLGEKWLLLITFVLLMMSQHQTLEVIRLLESSTYPLDVPSEIFETTANLLMAGSSYYVLRFAQKENELAEELERTRDRYSQLVENAPGAILVLEEGEIVYANPSATSLFGPAVDGNPEGASLEAFVHPGDAESLAADLSDLESTGDPVTIPPTRFLIDGELRRITITAAQVTYEGNTAIQAVLQDVTDLREYEEQLTKTFENSNDAILVVDPDADEILECNPKACDVLGYERSEFLETGPSEIHPQELDRFRGFIDAVRSEGGYRTEELSCRRHDGTEIPAEISGATIMFRGRECLLAIVRDISDRKRRERRLNVLNRVLRHNLRNDMNIIKGGATTLEGSLSDPDLSDLATRVRERADDLLTLGEEIRAVESTIKGGAEGETRRIDAASLVIDTIEDIRMNYPEARIEASVPDRLPVRGEESLSIAIEQVIENGIVHNDEPTPEVRVVAETPAADEEWVELRIADNGPGLPDQERSVIIEGEEITALEHGSGLGLWVAVWTVEAFGGDVGVLDRESDGTTLVFRLKRAPEASKGVPAPE